MLFRHLKSPRGGIGYTFLYVSILFLMTGGGWVYTNKSDFCSGCHTMKDSHETWRVSSHREIECLDCHIEPGKVNFIKTKLIRMGNDLISQIFYPPDPQEIRSHVSSMACIRCHMEIMRISEIARRDLPDRLNRVGLIIEHKRHLEAFKNQQFRQERDGCTVCHSKVVHGSKFKGYPVIIPREEDCFRCHDEKRSYKGKILSRKCPTCHTQEGLSEFLFDSVSSRLERKNN